MIRERLDHPIYANTPETGMSSQMNATWEADSEAFNDLLDVGFSVLFGIVILGCVTTPMTPVILCKVNIGSGATKVLLLSLAVVDMGLLLCVMFNNIVPWSVRFHIDLKFTDVTCNLIEDIKRIFATCSCWYVVMVTAERFAVIYFPLKTLNFFTWRKAVGVSLALPILVAVIFSWASTISKAVVTEDNFIACADKASRLYTALSGTNIGVSFISTVTITLILNIAIIIRLKRSTHFNVQKRKLYRRQSLTVNRVTNTSFTISDTSSNSAALPRDNAEEVTDSLVTYERNRIRQTATIKRKDGVKKATRIVLSASIIFTATMLPQAVFSIYSMVTAETEKVSYSTAHLVIAFVAGCIGYLTPPANMVIYVLASNNPNNYKCFKKKAKNKFCI